MIELLSPAGNMEKLRAAVRYGANAVYFAGQGFGMRASADNFTAEEMKEAVEHAHAHGVKAYVTVNTMPRTGEYGLLEKYLRETIAPAAPDALIIADIGVLELVRSVLPKMEIHLSTQANAVSAAACTAWHRLGAKRIVLARELSLEEIREIRRNTPKTLELEAFIHGSMCISYSGRCLLSGFLTGRDANRGMCTQPCRWHFTASAPTLEIREEKRPDIPIPLTEVDGETFIMSSKDTCMIEHIPALMEAGIDSFKIEGRMKSAYYTAVVTNAYRMAMDAYQAGEYQYDPLWRRELESVSHREYATGYYFSDPHTDANLTSDTGYLFEKAYLAMVEAYNEESGEAICLQRNKFSVGDTVELLTPGKTGRAFTVYEMRDAEGASITAVPHPQMRFRLKMPFPVQAGDIIRACF